MNRYEGKELLFLFDFIFSFYFLTLYFNENYKTFFAYLNNDNGNDKNEVGNSADIYSDIPIIDFSSTISDSIFTDEENTENLLDNNNKLREIFYIFIFFVLFC